MERAGNTWELWEELVDSDIKTSLLMNKSNEACELNYNTREDALSAI